MTQSRLPGAVDDPVEHEAVTIAEAEPFDDHHDNVDVAEDRRRRSHHVPVQGARATIVYAGRVHVDRLYRAVGVDAEQIVPRRLWLT